MTDDKERVDAARDKRIPLCEACAAGRHRAYCRTFPVPCRDLRDLWDEAVDAARSESRWLPIETAPRDGTRVLLFNKHGARRVGFFWKDSGTWRANAEWVTPTHWHPLPDAPEGEP